MQKQYTYYVVVNEHGHYLSTGTRDGDWGWFHDFIAAELLTEYVTAEWRALKYKGKVKRVTVTVEED